MLVTRANPGLGETQAGLVGLEILVDLGRLGQRGREGTLVAPGPEDSRE